jgi:hypothetical protein
MAEAFIAYCCAKKLRLPWATWDDLWRARRGRSRHPGDALFSADLLARTEAAIRAARLAKANYRRPFLIRLTPGLGLSLVRRGR